MRAEESKGFRRVKMVLYFALVLVFVSNFGFNASFQKGTATFIS